MTKYINPLEQNQFINKIFFKKYKVIKSIAAGSYGCVFEGLDLNKKEKVAIKLEKKSYVNFIEAECSYLLNLKGYGTPKVISFGISGNYYVLVEELLGKSLQMILNEKKTINIKDSCMIAIQMLDRLEHIHSKYIIHRDIKPANLLIGYSNPEVIYLVDFGFARKYRSSFSKKHLKLSNIKSAIGSVYYISINANSGLEQSRRDDLEAFGYSLIYMMKGILPWQIVAFDQNLTTVQKINKICKMKKEIKLQKLCENLPKQMIDYLNYCRNLDFEQDPDYNYLRNLFREILKNNNSINDLNFSWINISNSENIKYGSSKTKIESTKSIVKKRGLHNRLFQKISESLSKMKEKNENKESRSEKYNTIVKLEKKRLDDENVKNIKKVNSRNKRIDETINNSNKSNFKTTEKNNTSTKIINIYYCNEKLNNILTIADNNCKNNIKTIPNSTVNKPLENKNINNLKRNETDIQYYQNNELNNINNNNDLNSADYINGINKFHDFCCKNIKRYKPKFFSIQQTPNSRNSLKKTLKNGNTHFNNKNLINNRIGNIETPNEISNIEGNLYTNLNYNGIFNNSKKKTLKYNNTLNNEFIGKKLDYIQLTSNSNNLSKNSSSYCNIDCSLNINQSMRKKFKQPNDMIQINNQKDEKQQSNLGKKY